MAKLIYCIILACMTYHTHYCKPTKEEIRLYIDGLVHSLATTAAKTYQSVWVRMYNQFVANTNDCRNIPPATKGGYLSLIPCGWLKLTSELNKNLSWTIATNPETYLNISLLYVNLADSNGLMDSTCGVEAVVIACPTQRVKVICGKKLPSHTVCTTNKVYIFYRVINIFAHLFQSLLSSPRGFLLNYQVVGSDIHHVDETYEQFFLTTRAIFYGVGYVVPGYSRYKSMQNYYIQFVTVVSGRFTIMTNGQQPACERFWIYDGPTSTSPHITGRFDQRSNWVYISTAFVLSFHLYIANLAECAVRRPLQFIYTVSESPGFEKIKEIQVTEALDLNISSTIQNDRHHLIKPIAFLNAPKSHLNITFTSVHSEGPTDDVCMHWGVAVYEYDQFRVANILGGFKDYAKLIVAPMLLVCKSVFIREYNREIPVPSQYISRSNRVIAVVYSYDPGRFPFRVGVRVAPSVCVGAMSFCGPSNGLVRMEIAVADLSRTADDDEPLIDPGIEPLDRDLRRDYLMPDCDVKTGTLLVVNPYSLCVQEFDSKVLDFHGASCVALQTPFIAHTKRAVSDLCKISVSTEYYTRKGIKLSINTSVSITSFTEYGASCDRRLNLSPKAASYTYHSKCASVILQVERGKYGPYQGRRISENPDSPLLLEGEPGAIHYMQETHHVFYDQLQVQHFQLSELYVIIYYRFGAEQMLPIFQSISTITIVVSRCEMACLEVKMEYLTPNIEILGMENSRISETELYRDSTVEFVCIEPKQEIVFLQPQRYLQRYLSMRHHSGDNCTVTSDINPSVPINNLVDSYHLSVTSHACCDDVSTYYYVIWKSMNITWLEAESTCALIGGKLPRVDTREGASLLEKIALGSRFASGQSAFPSPQRLRSKYGIFVSKVSAGKEIHTDLIPLPRTIILMIYM